MLSFWGWIVSEIVGLGPSQMQELMVELGVPVEIAGWLDGPSAVLFGVFCMCSIFFTPILLYCLLDLWRDKRVMKILD